MTLTRRRFVQGAGAASLGLLAGCGRPTFRGQPEHVAHIGFLANLPAPSGTDPGYETFKQALAEQGWREGNNLRIEWRFTEGHFERLPDLAADLARLPVDLIVTRTSVEARAAKAVTPSIPIIFAVGGDVVGIGLVDSLAHPGGNVTGLTNMAPDLAGKRLELLKGAVPQISRVGAIWNGVDSSMGREYREATVAAEALGIELQSFPIRAPNELAAAFDTARSTGVDAFLIISDAILVIRNRSQIVELAARSRLPTMSGDTAFAREGGFTSYGPSGVWLWERTAAYVDRILKGATPADLPVERPMRFDFAINLKTAQALGVSIPQHVLLQATEIIQ
jgi:putative ABC transport system substrate-binding protein